MAQEGFWATSTGTRERSVSPDRNRRQRFIEVVAECVLALCPSTHRGRPALGTDGLAAGCRYTCKCQGADLELNTKEP